MSRGGRPPRGTGDLLALIEEMVDRRFAEMIQVGTVEGEDGGAVRVKLDGAERAGEVGRAKTKGVRHEKGDRVAMLQLPGGGELVLPGITDGKGAVEQAVGNEQLYTDAVDGRALRKDSVGKDHIVKGAVVREHIGAKAIGNDELDTEIDLAKGKPGSLPKSRLDPAVQQKVDDAITDADIQDAAKRGKPKLATESFVKGAIPKQPDLSKYVKKTDLRDVATSADLRGFVAIEDLRQLERELKDYVDTKVKSSKPPKGEQ